MALIFTDLPTGSGSAPSAVLEISKYQRHPWVHWESSNIGRITPIWNIIVQYYFWSIRLLHFLCFKICFPIDNHCKRWNVFSDLPKITCIFWTLLRVCHFSYSYSIIGHEVRRNCLAPWSTSHTEYDLWNRSLLTSIHSRNWPYIVYKMENIVIRNDRALVVNYTCCIICDVWCVCAETERQIWRIKSWYVTFFEPFPCKFMLYSISGYEFKVGKHLSALLRKFEISNSDFISGAVFGFVIPGVRSEITIRITKMAPMNKFLKTNNLLICGFGGTMLTLK